MEFSEYLQWDTMAGGPVFCATLYMRPSVLHSAIAFHLQVCLSVCAVHNDKTEVLKLAHINFHYRHVMGNW